MSGDTSASEYSTIITYNNGTYTGSDWKFGFYMPRSYDTILNTNPNLVMQICNSESYCQDLAYQTAPSVTDNDLSAGYTTIIAPTVPFTLISNQTYTIRLLHNNQWGPGNYSAVPQNFFLIAGNQVFNMAPSSSTYNLIDYNQTNVTNLTNAHINSIWSNSSSESNVNIIPSPVSYVNGSGSYLLQSGLVIHNLLNNNNEIANDIKNDLLTDLNISSTIDNNNSSSGIIINPHIA